LNDGTIIIRTVLKVRQTLRRTGHHQSIRVRAIMQRVWVVFVSQVSTLRGVSVDAISISSLGLDGGSPAIPGTINPLRVVMA